MPMIVPGSWGPEKILGFRCNNVRILEKKVGGARATNKDNHLDHQYRDFGTYMASCCEPRPERPQLPSASAGGAGPALAGASGFT